MAVQAGHGARIGVNKEGEAQARPTSMSTSSQLFNRRGEVTLLI